MPPTQRFSAGTSKGRKPTELVNPVYLVQGCCDGSGATAITTALFHVYWVLWFSVGFRPLLVPGENLWVGGIGFHRLITNSIEGTRSTDPYQPRSQSFLHVPFQSILLVFSFSSCPVRTPCYNVSGFILLILDTYKLFVCLLSFLTYFLHYLFTS